MRVTDQKQQVLGYTCKKMLYRNDSGEEVKFWVANDSRLDGMRASPVPGLLVDGVVMRLDMENVSYRATEIATDVQPSVPSGVPENYRRITEAQYRDLQEEQIDKLKQKLKQ